MSASNQRRVLISGASSGIGRATAERFAREGWSVCLTAKDEPMLRTVCDALPGVGHVCVAGDYSDPSTAERIGSVIDESWDGQVHAMINSAGISRSLPIVDSDLSAWRECLDVMLDGAIHLTRAVVGRMPDRGRIVHITSIHAKRAESGASSYGMAKAAIEQYVRGLALELACRDILVNAIAPGFIATAMSEATGVNELETEWFRRHYIEGHHLPLRRPGQADEVAGVALFLAGPDASYITGQTIHVDGGLNITF